MDQWLHVPTARRAQDFSHCEDQEWPVRSSDEVPLGLLSQLLMVVSLLNATAACRRSRILGLLRAVNHVLEPAMEMENPLSAIEATQLSLFEEMLV